MKSPRHQLNLSRPLVPYLKRVNTSTRPEKGGANLQIQARVRRFFYLRRSRAGLTEPRFSSIFYLLLSFVSQRVGNFPGS